MAIALLQYNHSRYKQETGTQLNPSLLFMSQLKACFVYQGMSSLFSPKRFGDGSARAFLLRFSFHGKPLSIEFLQQEMECQVDSVSSSPIS